jgi:electron transport complex protein RnfE
MNTAHLAPLWQRNPALVHLLGLSPLLGMSHSLVTALGLGIATLALIAAAAPLLAALRPRLSPELRIPASVLLIATLTACIELLLQAFRLPLYQSLGVFLPLIAATGLTLLEPPGTAPAAAVRHGLAAGSGYLLALSALGAIRELLAHGTLFRDLELLAGASAAGWELRLLPANYDFPFWALPAGGFVSLGFLIALQRLARTHSGADTAPPASAVRARVTDSQLPHQAP